MSKDKILKKFANTNIPFWYYIFRKKADIECFIFFSLFTWAEQSIVQNIAMLGINNITIGLILNNALGWGPNSFISYVFLSSYVRNVLPFPITHFSLWRYVQGDYYSLLQIHFSTFPNFSQDFHSKLIKNTRIAAPGGLAHHLLCCIA